MKINEILEVLGNESRRRILSLLSKKPCYVSEISYSLKMAPKAVLEHLEKLEKAGILKSYEDGRRRYYYINKNLRVEISITPHRFNTSITFGDMNADLETLVDEARKMLAELRHEVGSMAEIYKALQGIEEIEKWFSKIQGLMTSRLTEMFEVLLDEIERSIKDEVERIALLGLTKGASKVLEIAEGFGLPYGEVETALEKLRSKGIVEKIRKNGDVMWRIKC
jgi:ArsR family transcriptional regulator